MRQLLIAVALASIGMLAAIGVASADAGPHGGFTPTTDSCAGCHRAHTAQGAKILKVDESSLCLACHDGTGSKLDSLDGAQVGTNLTQRATGGTPGGITGALKGGGFGFARINTAGTVIAPATSALPGDALPNGSAGVAVTSAHIKGPGVANALASSGIMWGAGPVSTTANTGQAGTTLQCADCHNPHGGGTYRLLRPFPVIAPSPANGGAGVIVADEPTKNYTTTNYFTQYASGATLPSATFAKDISTWCSQCHTRYQADGTAGSTDSTDAVFRYRHTSDGSSSRQAGLGSPYRVSGQPIPTFTSFCLQCHVPHGGNASMAGDGKSTFSSAVPFPDGTQRGTDSSALLKIDNRGTCFACHGKPA